MTSQPDKLFREKLENFSTTTPHAAWGRIEAGLNQSSHSYWWIKIAASIAFVGVATFLLWPNTTTQQTKIASQNKPIESITPIAKETTTASTENSSIAETTEQKTIQSKNVTTSTIAAQEINSETLVAEIMPAQTEIIPIENSVTETVAQLDETVESQTIIYSAEEVNAKFLKKELVAEATTEEKKTSGIQKLIGVAYTLASAEPALGNIRQRKDEVLALNFRDKKQGHN